MSEVVTDRASLAPGLRSRWLQGFVASNVADLKYTLVASAVSGGFLAWLYLEGLLSTRSVIGGFVAGLAFTAFFKGRESWKVARHPFAIFEYVDWVEEQKASEVEVTKQDWYYWYRSAKPYLRYKTSPAKIAKHIKRGATI